MRIVAGLIFLVIASCTRNHTIGTRNHQFGKKAKHIVWFQVEGLEEEHIALTRFSSDSSPELTPFEKMTCSGSLWDYNFFKIRPRPVETFLGQSLGSQKIKGDCSDIDRDAIWNFYERSGYQVGIIEGEAVKEESFLKYRKCETDQLFLKQSFFWSQSVAPASAQLFHHQEVIDLSKPGVFFDKSCQKGECFVTLKSNVTKIWSDMIKNFSKTFFVVRHSSFSRKVLKKDILGAKKSLEELIDVLNFFLPMAQRGEVSLVVTSGNVRRFELPRSGKDWSKFESSGKNVIYRRSGFTAKAWSIGPGAENFCGTYEASNVLRRFLWTPEKDVFYLSL